MTPLGAHVGSGYTSKGGISRALSFTMPFQIANVRRAKAPAKATFDLILRDAENEIEVRDCSLVNDQREPAHVSLRAATLNKDAAKAVLLKVIASLSFG